MAARIELEGMFGICALSCPFPGFTVRAVDQDQPLLSETGFRSFLDVHAEPTPGITTDEFVSAVIAAYVEREGLGRIEEARPR